MSSSVNTPQSVIDKINNQLKEQVLTLLNDLIREYQSQGLVAVAINSNDVKNYPDDSPEKMITLSNEMDYCFPYLFDEDQSVAKAYKAACTPDFFLFDNEVKLAYRGPTNYKVLLFLALMKKL